MEDQRFEAANSAPILANMAVALHVSLMDSERGAAISLGQSYITTENSARTLSRHNLDLKII